MTQNTKKWLGAAALVLSSSVLTGAVMRTSTSRSNDAYSDGSFLGAQPAAMQMPNAAPTGAPAVAGLVDLTAAAERSVNSVVYIKVTQNAVRQRVRVRDPFEDFFGDFFGYGNRGQGREQEIETQPRRQGAGSGVIITTDLALVKVEAKDLPAITIGNSDDLKIGQWVLAVGNPFNLTSTVTAGIVSAKARSLGTNGVESFIQTDAAINAGNSGGALVNERGELVGINAMLYSQTGSYSGYGFAIPTTIMNKVVKDLKEFGVVQRALLGISGMDVTNYIDKEKAEDREVDLGTTKGIYVQSVEEKSTASEVGLQKGDVVTAIDGKEVTKMAELQEALSQRRPGDKVSITYLRNKKSHTSSATLRNIQGGTEIMEEMDMDLFGAQLKPLSDENKRQLALSYGLEVVAVKNGKMKDAGIQKGMILQKANDKELRTVEDFEEAVRMTNQSRDRTLWIQALTQSGRRVAAVIDLSENKGSEKK